MGTLPLGSEGTERDFLEGLMEEIEWEERLVRKTQQSVGSGIRGERKSAKLGDGLGRIYRMMGVL